MKKIKIDYISDIQKKIIKSPDSLKLINGCAGSRKTDTLIKCAIYEIVKFGHHVLFLSEVNSVIDEIKNRVETILGVTMHKIRKSNHYIAYYEGKTIQISTFSSWIHSQLSRYCGYEGVENIGDHYSEKTELLIRIIGEKKCGYFYLKNDIIANLILIDEFQDIENSKIKILSEMLKYESTNRFFFVGDYLQTIYLKNTDNLQEHPMRVMQNHGASTFQIDICYRCPLAHITFCNFLMEEFQKEYGIPPIRTLSKNQEDKPFLFPHLGLIDNSNSLDTSRRILMIIEILFNIETSLLPEDIVVICPKSNDSAIYHQLKNELHNYYQKRGLENHVTHFQTRADGYHNTIDWEKAKGKTVLTSIHGEKGKGHQVVFFIGFSHKSLPMEFRVGKKEELIDKSLMNVALTRSLKYLFIGFTNSHESHYLSQHREDLQKHCYLAWKPEMIDHPVYRKIAKSLQENVNFYHLGEPQFKNEKRKKLLYTGLCDFLNVKDNISKNIENPLKTINLLFCHRKVFGEVTLLQQITEEDHYLILGILGELMIQRKVNRDDLMGRFKYYGDKNNIKYEKNERFLCFVRDMKINQFFGTVFYEENLQKIIKSIEKSDDGQMGHMSQYKKYLASLADLKKYPRLVIDHFYATSEFSKNIKCFLKPVDNREIPSTVWWNISLFHIQIVSKLSMPYNKNYYNYFSENLEKLHNNIDNFIPYLSTKLKFDNDHNIIKKITDQALLGELGFDKEDDNLVFKEGYYFGIKGISDIYDRENETLIEIKTSKLKDIPDEWIVQSYMYYLLRRKIHYPVKYIIIVNILSGYFSKYEIDKSEQFQLIEKFLCFVFDRNGYHRILQDEIIQDIKKNYP